MLQKAKELATRKHAGQVDKAGAPYILHLERVAGKVSSEESKTVAYLHDILEDTDTTQEELAAEFPSRVVGAVCMLTRHEAERYESYIGRIACEGNSVVREVKLADLEDHLDYADQIPASLQRRYLRAKARL